MNKIDQELLVRMNDLRRFCETNGYPLHEFLETEIVYYKRTFLTDFSIKNFDMIPVTDEHFKMIEEELKALQS